MNTEMLGMGVGDVECLLRVPHHPLPPPPKKNHVCNPSTGDVEAERTGVQGHPGQT